VRPWPYGSRQGFIEQVILKKGTKIATWLSCAACSSSACPLSEGQVGERRTADTSCGQTEGGESLGRTTQGGLTERKLRQHLMGGARAAKTAKSGSRMPIIRQFSAITHIRDDDRTPLLAKREQMGSYLTFSSIGPCCCPMTPEGARQPSVRNGPRGFLTNRVR
jgi:hypothetical protein